MHSRAPLNRAAAVGLSEACSAARCEVHDVRGGPRQFGVGGQSGDPAIASWVDERAEMPVTESAGGRSEPHSLCGVLVFASHGSPAHLAHRGGGSGHPSGPEPERRRRVLGRDRPARVPRLEADLRAAAPRAHGDDLPPSLGSTSRLPRALFRDGRPSNSQVTSGRRTSWVASYTSTNVKREGRD